MKLVVYELKAGELSGTYTAPKNLNLAAIRPHLYRHNFATGTLKIEVYNNASSLIATSETISISSIVGPLSRNFFHGYVRFLVNVGLVKDQTYKFKLVAEGGYSFAEDAYVGWCNGFDLGKYPAVYIPASSLNYPLDIELWERKTKI